MTNNISNSLCPTPFTTKKPRVVVSPSITNSNNSSKPSSKPRKLSTERSRLCRQRQKQYAESLEQAVKHLKSELQSLQTLRALRQEQAVHSRGSPTGALAQIILEYFNMFRHGWNLERTPIPPLGSDTTTRKRTIETAVAMQQPSAQAQRSFMFSVMDPSVVIYDWIGRSTVGAETLVNGWTAWSAWHESLWFELQSVDVVASNDAFVVKSKGLLHVQVNDQTIKHLFPHIAHNNNLLEKLLGKHVAYPMSDSFYFSDEQRVVQYSCDINFIGALQRLVNDLTSLLELVEPPNQASLNDLAIRTSPAAMNCPPPRVSRLDVVYLLS